MNTTKFNSNLVANMVNFLDNEGYHYDDDQKALLTSETLYEFIDSYLLPVIVREGGQDTRGWRLSPTFIKLMTEFGPAIMKEDQYRGEILMELALQRITRHDYCSAINYVQILPQEYKKYSAAWDQPGLWGDTEWEFMQAHMITCMNLSTPAYRDHAKSLVLDILKKSAPYSHDCWFGMGTKHNRKEVFAWAAMTATTQLGVNEVAQELAKTGNWRSYISFFAAYLDFINFEELCKCIDLDKETYYTGVSRSFMKCFHLYDDFTKKHIYEDIKAADWGELE